MVNNNHEPIQKDNGNLMDELLANPFENPEDKIDAELNHAKEPKLIDVLPEEDK